MSSEAIICLFGTLIALRDEVSCVHIGVIFIGVSRGFSPHGKCNITNSSSQFAVQYPVQVMQSCSAKAAEKAVMSLNPVQQLFSTFTW